MQSPDRGSLPGIPTTTLGRTGLQVSRLGLGCGGPSRLGVNADQPPDESIRILQFGIRHGINFIDTAEAYGNETLVGQAIRPFSRDEIVISTKMTTVGDGGELLSESDARRHLEESLERLGCEFVDVYHLHGVHPDRYERTRDRFYPLMERFREEGLIRHIGITEGFNADMSHRMLELALEDDLWDVIMVGFNILNQSAAERIFPAASSAEVGTLVMFAVRRALSNREHFAGIWAKISGADPDGWGPLQFLLDEGHVHSIAEAAYRFGLSETRADVVLCGTGNLSHLKQNIESVEKGGLSEDTLSRLRDAFQDIPSLTGE